MRSILLASATLLLSAPLFAQNSQPAAPVARRAPEPLRDVTYPGVLTLEVDASDTRQGLFRVRETIPVARSGRLTLRYPRWLPGNHAPTGTIEAIAGLTFTGGGRTLRWQRNPEDVFAFDVDVPAGVRAVEARFDYLSDTEGAIGRTEMTADMLNLQWEKVSLYPAGHYVRRIRIRPTVILPAGFTGVSAIDGEPRQGRVAYVETDYETMVDSPMFAGRHFRAWDLGNNVDLNVVADRAADLEASADQILAHRRLVEQARSLFGTSSFDRYDFLLALSNELSGIGLEHHRSSENGVDRGYFTDWANQADDRTLLPHEFSHSWNGKHRRPADLWTPDYNVPMQNSLLWLYEGQTTFWQYVLGARSGMVSTAEALGEIASNAALYQAQPGRRWRSVADTTNQQIIGYRRTQLYPSWQRGTDYYREAALHWLEADMIIREASGGQRSLDDFARAFFGGREGDWGVRTYDYNEVVATLNRIQPYDWNSFFQTRILQPNAQPPLGGITRGGYRLVWRDEPNPYDASRMRSGRSLDLSYSLGLTIASGGRVSGVLWDGPAFAQAIRPGATILAINGREYSDDEIKSAITAARTGRDPIRLLIRDGRVFREAALDYHDGLRFPHLERVGDGPALLDRLLEPRPQ